MGTSIRNETNFVVQPQIIRNEGKPFYVVDSNVTFGDLTWIIDENPDTFYAQDDTAFMVRLIRSTATFNNITVVGNRGSGEKSMRKYTFVIDCTQNSTAKVKYINTRNMGNPDPSYNYRNHDVIKTDVGCHAEVDLMDCQDVGDTLFDCKGTGIVHRALGQNIHRAFRGWSNCILNLGDISGVSANEIIWRKDSTAMITVGTVPEPTPDPVPTPPKDDLDSYEYKEVKDNAAGDKIKAAQADGWLLVSEPVQYVKSTVEYEALMKRKK